MPRVRTRSSTRRVLTPRTYASWITASRARSARRRGSSRDGKYEPSRTRGIASSTEPTRVSQRRSRYPLRLVSRRSGSRSPLGTPVSSETSASMSAWASTRTPSRRTSTSPSAVALRRVSSSAMLSSAIVVVLSCRRFLLQRREDDAVAVLFHGLLRCYTKSGDSTGSGGRQASTTPVSVTSASSADRMVMAACLADAGWPENAGPGERRSRSTKAGGAP